MISTAAKSTLFAVARPCRLHTSSHTRVSAIKHQGSQSSQAFINSGRRQLSQTPRKAYPRKDSQDKDSINTEATEYSKSATDDEGARQGDAAFNPDITDPQHQKDVAGKGTEGTVSERVRLPFRYATMVSWSMLSYS